MGQPKVPLAEEERPPHAHGGAQSQAGRPSLLKAAAESCPRHGLTQETNPFQQQMMNWLTEIQAAEMFEKQRRFPGPGSLRCMLLIRQHNGMANTTMLVLQSPSLRDQGL